MSTYCVKLKIRMCLLAVHVCPSRCLALFKRSPLVSAAVPAAPSKQGGRREAPVLPPDTSWSNLYMTEITSEIKSHYYSQIRDNLSMNKRLGSKSLQQHIKCNHSILIQMEVTGTFVKNCETRGFEFDRCKYVITFVSCMSNLLPGRQRAPSPSDSDCVL